MGQQVKEAGKNGIELFIGMLKTGIYAFFALLFGVFLGPISMLMALVPGIKEISTSMMRFWAKAFKNVQVLPILIPFLVPFFLVYFFLMIIPELIVGTFSDEVVEILDNMVIAIGVFSWIAGIVAWRFFL